MKSIRPLLAALFLACFAQPAHAIDPAPVGIAGNFTLVFRDEFTSTTLNRNVWNDNWMGCRGCITKPVNGGEIAAMDPARVTIANGKLKLTAVSAPKVTINGKNYYYRSGMVETARRKEWTPPVVFEFRVAAMGSGQVLKNWPIAWTNGYHDRVGSGSWPSAGENDILENGSGGVGWNYHAPRINAGRNILGNWVGYHTYAARWRPTRIDYFFDGRLVSSVTSGVLRYPHYIVINYCVSTQHGGPLVIPGWMLVDYVRVWEED